LYWYAKNNPVVLVDPDGRDPARPNDTRTVEERNLAYSDPQAADRALKAVEANLRAIEARKEATKQKKTLVRTSPEVRATTQADRENSAEFNRQVAACNDDPVKCSKLWPEAYGIWRWRGREQEAEGLRRRASEGGVSVHDQAAAEKTAQFGQIVLTVIPIAELAEAGLASEIGAGLERVEAASAIAPKTTPPATPEATPPVAPRAVALKPAFGQLPKGAKVIKTGADYTVFEVDGVPRIRFKAAHSRQVAPISARPNNSNNSMASVADDEKVYVFEGCHRAHGAACGDMIPPELGGVHDAPGVLEYNYDADAMAGPEQTKWGAEHGVSSGKVKKF
jgi:hypothetical protein